MSKQQIFIRHKDEIMLEIIRLQRLVFHDDQIEAEAVNHGKIQGLMWAAGLYNNNKGEGNGGDSVSVDMDSDTFDQWNDLNEHNEKLLEIRKKIEENRDANKS